MTSTRPAALGIDFGTSNTVAAVRRADGRVQHQLYGGSPQLPSAVFLAADDLPVVGVDAIHNGRRRPDCFEPHPKRRIDDGTVLLGQRELPVRELIGAVLGEVAREVEQRVGIPESVTMTVPAAWGPTRRHVIKDAAAAAGLGAVGIVPEPVAAAAYFVEHRGSQVPVGSGVVVYDLGGGTFDATVLRRLHDGFEVLAIDGSDRLGGIDLDQALAVHLSRSVRPQDERWRRLLEPTEPADFRHRTALLEEVRLAKERLSRRPSTELTLPLFDVDSHLTREELEDVARPLLEQTVRFTQGVIRESGLGKQDLAGLYLVGAASRMPLAATLLHQELGFAPTAVEQPELVVAEGALSAPAVTVSPPAQRTSAPEPYTPVPPTQSPIVEPVTRPPGSTLRGSTPSPQRQSKVKVNPIMLLAISVAISLLVIVVVYAVDQAGIDAGDCINRVSGDFDLDEASGVVSITDDQIAFTECDEASIAWQSYLVLGEVTSPTSCSDPEILLIAEQEGDDQYYCITPYDDETTSA